MNIGYYAFGLFVTSLICLIAIIVRLLFGDIRRHSKHLDEQEKKLLKLYNSVETIMEDFTDQSKAVLEEMRDIETRAALSAFQNLNSTAGAELPPYKHSALNSRTGASLAPANTSAPEPQPIMKIDSSRIRAASEVLERAERMIRSSEPRLAPPAAKADNGAAFQRIIEETTSLLPKSVVESANQAKTTHTQILEMAEQGSSTSQIAKKLGITQNEVLLVVGLGINNKENKQ